MVDYCIEERIQFKEIPQVIFPTIAANLATTGCGLLLLQRGPSRRLRLLTLSVGLMSLTQTAACLQFYSLGSGSAYIPQGHQSMVACLSMLCIYLLGREMSSRNSPNRKLQPLEHAQLLATPVEEIRQMALMVVVQPQQMEGPTRRSAARARIESMVDRVRPAAPRFYTGPACRTVDISVLNPCVADTDGLVALTIPLGTSTHPMIEAPGSREGSIPNSSLFKR